MGDKSSVKFIGNSGLLFTDEDGVTFFVYTETTSLENYDRILYSKDINPNCNQELTDNDKKRIVSKILELTKDIKWKIK